MANSECSLKSRCANVKELPTKAARPGQALEQLVARVVSQQEVLIRSMVLLLKTNWGGFGRSQMVGRDANPGDGKAKTTWKLTVLPQNLRL